MKNKKIILILITVIAIAFFVFKKGEINNNTVSEKLMAYTNDDLGFSFGYLRSYGELKEEYLSSKKAGFEFLVGKGLQISFENNFSILGLFAASRHYKDYAFEQYRGPDDQDIFCPYFNLYDAEKMSLCLPLNLAGQETFQRYLAEVKEGSVFVRREVYLDLNKSSYAGLMIYQGYPELESNLKPYIINNDLDEFSKQAEMILERLQNKDNLSPETLQKISEFEAVLNTVKIW